MKVIITDLLTGEEGSASLFAPTAYTLKEIHDEVIQTWKESVIEQIVFSVYKMAYPSKF